MSIIEHFSDILEETKHFSGKNRALIKVEHFSGEKKHNVQRPNDGSSSFKHR